jgi:hypothetical protein
MGVFVLYLLASLESEFFIPPDNLWPRNNHVSKDVLLGAVVLCSELLERALATGPVTENDVTHGHNWS